jgi:hypothetical protein
MATGKTSELSGTVPTEMYKSAGLLMIQKLVKF